MNKYANWTKDQLIQRIVQLETKQPPLKLTGKPLDFTKFSKRRIAIRFAYLGWNYHGLAYQREGHKTVEYEILKAFYITKCIPSIEPNDCNFSRCGRTDADVSAMAQVISLDVRSNLSFEQLADAQNDNLELDYLKILNSHLPSDILAYEICLRPPPEFDARFSCTGRRYHYYFHKQGLDLQAMRAACQHLVGEHDFRNFCKIDGSKQITNFNRRIRSAKIVENDEICYLDLSGTAFLWNQVRSIMAILFLIGQRYEEPSLVLKLLDTKNVPCRPAYEIAWGVPLVLYDCEFPEMEWQTSSYTSVEGPQNVWHELLQKQNMTRLMISRTQPFAPHGSGGRVNVGYGVGRRCGRYTNVMQRKRGESAEVQNEKYRLRMGRIKDV